MEMVGVRKGDGKRIFPVTKTLNLMKIQKRIHYQKHNGKTTTTTILVQKKNLNLGLLRANALKGPWTDLPKSSKNISAFIFTFIECDK